MDTHPAPSVAIVDYGLGNLYSVARACERVGLKAQVTSDKRDLLAADAVILPGVGAFGDAMHSLRSLDLIEPLRHIADSNKPLMGICLGLQLLMSESEEFGTHAGLNIVPGRVMHFGQPTGPRGPMKVPQVGWNGIYRPAAATSDPWRDSPLAGIADGTYMYFVHSFYVQPTDPNVVLSVSRYGSVEFCSAVCRGNLFAVQFHPERSGREGIRVYQTFSAAIKRRQAYQEHRDAA